MTVQQKKVNLMPVLCISGALSTHRWHYVEQSPEHPHVLCLQAKCGVLSNVLFGNQFSGRVRTVSTVSQAKFVAWHWYTLVVMYTYVPPNDLNLRQLLMCNTEIWWRRLFQSFNCSSSFSWSSFFLIFLGSLVSFSHLQWQFTRYRPAISPQSLVGTSCLLQVF